MKPTFIPDYPRHTEFTPAMRIVLAELAEQRILHDLRFRIAQTQYETIMKGNGPIIQADRLYRQMQDHLEAVEEIDIAIRKIYRLHGRLN